MTGVSHTETEKDNYLQDNTTRDTTRKSQQYEHKHGGTITHSTVKMIWSCALQMMHIHLYSGEQRSQRYLQGNLDTLENLRHVGVLLFFIQEHKEKI